MMIRYMRRNSKRFALILLAVHLPGARLHAKTEACGRTRVYHGPARPFKAMARALVSAVTHSDYKRKAPRSFGTAKNKSSSSEVRSLRNDQRPAPVCILAGSTVRLAAAPIRAHPDALRPLPCDLSPSPPLHTRK